MNKYLGLFIDDDQKNFESIKRLFSLKNIQLLPYENLPKDINEIYQKVIDQNVDFVIIDYDLGKQAVKYTGIDVLKNIREQDAEIYIIYLTNKDFVEDHIGEFDQTVKKKELAKEIDNVVRRLTPSSCLKPMLFVHSLTHILVHHLYSEIYIRFLLP